jgi:hypothetical protein
MGVVSQIDNLLAGAWVELEHPAETALRNLKESREALAAHCIQCPQCQTVALEAAMSELDAILADQRKCFAEDSDAERFLGRVMSARNALAKHVQSEP